MEKVKKSIFNSPLLSTKIKSAKAKIFPEGVLGYFIGPTLALLANSILSNYFNMYMSNILNITSWANLFFTLLPGLSVIMVVIGNIIVGRLMDHNKSRAGKARPLILLSIPLSVLALIVLFIISPFATETASASTQMWAMVCIAIGYNLWFSIAYPCYYTSHAALVNLSTRSSKDRSLLATISNATALAAMGLCTMILPFFLKYLFVYQMDEATLLSAYGAGGFLPVIENGKIAYYTTVAGQAIYDAQASYNAWKIFVIALMVITAVGAIIEYYFTRERITEESFGSSNNEKSGAVTPLKEQAKICLKDKFWWIMIVFFFLYQLGGMIKNVSQLYYCQAMFADANGNYTTATGGSYSGTLAILGAIPTALGMVIAWPLSNKIGKGKAILFGAILSTAGGAIGFIAPNNFYVVAASFARLDARYVPFARAFGGYARPSGSQAQNQNGRAYDDCLRRYNGGHDGYRHYDTQRHAFRNGLQQQRYRAQSVADRNAVDFHRRGNDMLFVHRDHVHIHERRKVLQTGSRDHTRKSKSRRYCRGRGMDRARRENAPRGRRSRSSGGRGA